MRSAAKAKQRGKNIELTLAVLSFQKQVKTHFDDIALNHHLVVALGCVVNLLVENAVRLFNKC